jgi:hypothetical protein
MKKISFALLGLCLVSGAAFAAGSLFEEFRRRENTRLTQEQGNALSFLSMMKVEVTKIEELEIIEGGKFVYRDRDNIVCLGDLTTRMVRCKNKIGLTTVTLDGDAD